MYFQRETSQGLAAGRVSLVNARAPSQMLLLLLFVGTDVIVHPLIIKSCLKVEIAAAGFHDHGQQVFLLNPREAPALLGVNDTQIDSIQYLNFAKK